MDNIEIKYAVLNNSLLSDPYFIKEVWKQAVFFEPEPVLKDLIKTRGKDTSYLKCPAFQDYYKNCYLIRCPIDLTIRIKNNQIYTDQYDQAFYDKHIINRMGENSLYSMLSVVFRYTFFSNESVMLEHMYPTMHATDSIQNLNVISGTYDISKWIRGNEYGFEVRDPSKPIVLKRGDPLYYVRFVTDKNITITRELHSAELENISHSFVGVKVYVPGSTLERAYEIARPFMEAIKRKYFKKKSKCPFGFLRRKDE